MHIDNIGNLAQKLGKSVLVASIKLADGVRLFVEVTKDRLLVINSQAVEALIWDPAFEKSNFNPSLLAAYKQFNQQYPSSRCEQPLSFGLFIGYLVGYATLDPSNYLTVFEADMSCGRQALKKYASNQTLSICEYDFCFRELLEIERFIVDIKKFHHDLIECSPKYRH